MENNLSTKSKHFIRLVFTNDEKHFLHKIMNGHHLRSTCEKKTTYANNYRPSILVLFLAIAFSTALSCFNNSSLRSAADFFSFFSFFFSDFSAFFKGSLINPYFFLFYLWRKKWVCSYSCSRCGIQYVFSITPNRCYSVGCIATIVSV